MLQGIEPNFGSEPAVPTARRIILWQPYRSTSNQGNHRNTKVAGFSSRLPPSSIDHSSQVQRLGAAVSLDDQHLSFAASQRAQQVFTAYRNIWHEMYSAERLAERYADFTSAMEVVNRRYEAEKRRTWGLSNSLKRKKWQNWSAHLEIDLGCSDALVAYDQQKLDVHKAIHMQKLDMTKSIVAAGLARYSALASLMH